MSVRFVTRKIHAIIDYPVAASLIATPLLLGIGATQPLALWLSVATGIAALVLTLLTDHEAGVIKVIPYRLHIAVDRAVGVTFLAAPFVFGFSGLDAIYYWVNAAAVIAATFLLNATEPQARGLVTA